MIFGWPHPLPAGPRLIVAPRVLRYIRLGARPVGVLSDPSRLLDGCDGSLSADPPHALFTRKRNGSATRLESAADPSTEGA